MLSMLKSFLFQATVIVACVSLRGILAADPYFWDITDQAWDVNATLNEPWIQKYWSSGYFITSVEASEGEWVMVMSKQNGDAYSYSGQTYELSADFPAARIKEAAMTGLQITSATYSDAASLWLVVLSNRTAITKQRWHSSSTFPKQWIQEGYNSNYFISTIAYGKGLWLVAMDAYATPMKWTQNWFSSLLFPSTKIQEGEAKGESVTLLKVSTVFVVLPGCTYLNTVQ